MSNSTINKASGVSHQASHDEKENKNISGQKSDDSEQNEEIDEKLCKSEIKKASKFDENLSNQVENIGSLSTITKDIVINITDEVFQDVSNKKNEEHQNDPILLQKYIKLGIRETRNDFLQNQANKKIWVQYALGQGKGFGAGGDDGSGRNKFVLVVMILVLVMLLITAGWIILVFKVDFLFEKCRSAGLIGIISVSVGLLMIHYAVTCIEPCRKPPCGIIILVLTVILMSLLTGFVTSRYNTMILFHAFFATSAIVLVCAGLACTSFDFTSFWLYFIGIFVAFSVVASTVLITMALTGTKNKMLHLGILCVFVLLQSVALIMEIQMILGGKSMELEEDDYVMGAYLIYSSIVRMFLNVVKILGILND